MIRNTLRWMTGAAVVLAAGLTACESESVFEGEPTVAPPVTTFDAAGTADRAIHGGVLAISVIATDQYVGIDSVTIRYSGAMQGSFTRRYPNMPAQVRIDTVLAVPFGTQGEVLFEAFGMNRFGSTATPGTTTVLVVSEDTVRPAVSIASTQLPARAELGDEIVVRVQAEDDAFGSGLSRVGASVRVGSQLVSESQAVDGQVAATRDIAIPVNRLATGAANLQVEFYAWAVDQAGNCTAVGANGAVASCALVGIEPTFTGLAGVAGSFQVTDTRSFPAVMSAASIGDLTVDTNRRRVYYSNQANNSVESLSWTGTSLSFVNRAFVGARPWGITIDNTRDTLIVANSGGTNLSYVTLAGATMNEARRFETPNNTLWQLTPQDQSVVVSHLDFSDRPQHVAQDASGVVLYSTTPTAAAPQGSIRMVQSRFNWQQHEADMVLWTQIVDGNSWGPGSPPAPCYDPVTLANRHDPGCVIAFVDSVRIHFESPFLGTQLRVYDHVPGFPNQVIADTSSSWHEITTNLQSRGSDIFMHIGTWNPDFWFTSDTTFVASSGNRQWLSIGEGAVNPGRVWMWGAIGAHPRLFDREISDFVNIADFVSNTSDRIGGLSMNNDGLLLASRSESGVYLFSNPMRLRGSYDGADIAGGVGVALHPNATYPGGDPNVNWVAVGSAEPEIILIDSFNFRRKGRVPLVEPVGGPIRVVARLAGDPADILAHIFGVTQSGTVFWVPVRATYFTN